MIKIEHPWNDNENLIRHYSSNKSKSLLQKETGIIYKDAIDIYPCPYTYEEVDDPDMKEEE